MGLKVFIADLNAPCTSNSYLSACLREYCRRNALEVTADHAQADVVVVNGCNVVQGNWDLVDRFRERAEKTGTRVLAFGCTPTLGPGAESAALKVLALEKLLRRPDEVDRFFGGAAPFELVRMDDALEGAEFPKAANRPDPAGLCYLKISDGCQSQCGFCAIRQAKGLVRSLPLETILADFEAGLAKGKKRFFLACDDATCWGKDAGSDLSVLLARLIEAAPDCELVCNTFNPMSLVGIFDRVLPHLANFSFLSIPLQSGSDRVLKLMKRGYSTGEVLPLVDAIRRAHPRLTLNTDIVVGYPTETFAEFTDSVRAATRFDSAYFFVFQPRPETAGAELEGLVPMDEMRRRIAVVRRLKTRFRFDDSLAEEPPR